MSELKQTNQFAEAVASILRIVDNYLTSKMKDELNMVVQLKSNKLREEAQAKYDKFLKLINSNIKNIIKDKVKAQVSKIMPKVEKYVTETLGAKIRHKDEEPSAGSYRGSKQRRSGKEESSKALTQKESKSASSLKGATRSLPKSLDKSTQEEEHDPRVDDLEELFHQEFDTGHDDVSPVREATDVNEQLWNPSGSRTPDREWNQTKTVDDQPPQ
ncbi:hypothetical protein Tco_1460029 [Tanacetum coccineum]